MDNFIAEKRSRDSKERFLRYDLPIKKIAQAYLSGQPEYKIAKFYHVSRNVIRLRLLMAGIRPRTESEARRLCWQQMTPEQRKNQLKAAHDATKGSKMPLEALEKAAKTKEKNALKHCSKYELQFQKMLEKRGIKTVLQKAVGPYNCDLATFPVCMEIFGGNWHSYGRHAARFEKRIRYLLNHGWFVLIFPVNKRSPLTEAMADYAASYIKRIYRTKPTTCEYRVIWRCPKLITRGSLDSKHIAFVPPFTSTRDATTGQYKRIPR